MQFELGEYNSEDENSTAKSTVSASRTQGLSSTSLQLMEKSVTDSVQEFPSCKADGFCRLGLTLNPSVESEDLAPTDELKIFFCSRTHSQLTQLVQEVRRVKLPTPSWEKDRDTLAKVRDIEDLGSIGKKIGICPYYASRATIKPSQVSPAVS